MRIRLLLLTCVIVSGCQDLTTAELPAGTKNPQEYDTREGTLALYRGTIGTFQEALLTYLRRSAVLTDEYAAVGSGMDSVDLRRIPDHLPNMDQDYKNLHKVRGQAQQALGALARYAPDVSPALRGHLFALQGYAEILLADLYCSGIPLSTLDYGGDFTYRPGSSTQAVYAHALTLLDSALALSNDSTWVEHLARVGQARVLLQQAKYDDAVDVVRVVPESYRYVVRGVVVPTGGNWNDKTVAGLEGGNGLPYHSDPRVDAVFMGNTVGTRRPVYQSRKYLPAESAQPILVASGVEAQLIQAEADLHAGRIEAWLERLNALRTDGTFTIAGTDTVWGIGVGATLFTATPSVAAAHRGLPPLTDPAQGVIPPGMDSIDVRVNLLFAERAYWLFQTGQRQGDLRRLIREYGRQQDEVYPSRGASAQGLAYGTDVTLPITMDMEGANPHFRGCLHRDA